MSTAVKQAVRSFFTLKPKRVATTTTASAVFLSIGLVVTQIGDMVSTMVGLDAGAVEGNGAVAALINNHGYDWFIAMKLAASILLVWMFWKRPTAAAFVIALYTAVIVNNLFAIWAVI
jgi:hypothetical protein